MTWKEQLPETVREWDEAKNSESAEAFFDQIKNMRSTLGQSLRIPGEDASDEARQAFHTKLTEKVPGLIRIPGEDDAEGLTSLYSQLGTPETFEGYEADEAFASLRETAHGAKLTKKQFKALTDKLMADRGTAKETTTTEHAKSITDLKTLWGQAYNDKLAAAQLIRDQYFPFAPSGEELGADTIKAFAALGEQMAGESKGLQTEGTVQGAMTPAEAQLRISEILNNKKHPYWMPRDPGNKAAREKMTQLNKFAYPS